jgi:hypothetical protein
VSRLRSGCAGVLLLAASACERTDPILSLPSEPADGAAVHISTTATSYSPGAAVSFRVVNQGSVEYVWNPCVRTLERPEAAGWTPVDEGERMCTLEGWVLEPGRRTEASTRLAAALAPGKYRLRYRFSREGAEAVEDFQVSNEFAVGP